MTIKNVPVMANTEALEYIKYKPIELAAKYLIARKNGIYSAMANPQ